MSKNRSKKLSMASMTRIAGEVSMSKFVFFAMFNGAQVKYRRSLHKNYCPKNFTKWDVYITNRGCEGC